MNSRIFVSSQANGFDRSLPSPPISELIHLGPLTIHIYALCILAGFAAAYILTKRRYRRWDQDADFILETVTVAGLAGIIGARVGAVVTYPADYFGPGKSPWQVFKIWEGGLAIYGGLLFGFIAVSAWSRHRGKQVWAVFDSAAPGIALAQGIGRLGNWFNQEVFGRPTTLPWGLEIDAAHLPPGYPEGTLFHPTFLYELLWNGALCGALLWADRKARQEQSDGELRKGGSGVKQKNNNWARRWIGRPWQLSGWYLVGYGLGRALIESIRIDESLYLPGGIRLFTAVSVGVVIVGAIMIWQAKEPREGESANLPVPKN